MIKKFSVHGMCVSIESDRKLMAIVELEFTGFNQVNNPAEVVIKIEKVEYIAQKPPEGCVYTDNLLTKYVQKDSDSIITFFGPFSVIFTRKEIHTWQILCQYSPAFDQRRYFYLIGEVIYNLVYIALVNKGFYPLHAGALVTQNNKTVLICANSLTGKTTLCLAGLNDGWKILSDDMPLLKINNEQKKIEVFSFPRYLRAFEDTLLEFPMLKCCYHHSNEDVVFHTREIAISSFMYESFPPKFKNNIRCRRKNRLSYLQAYQSSLLQRATPTDIVILTRGDKWIYEPLMPHKAMNALIAENLKIYRFRNPDVEIYNQFCSILSVLVGQCELNALTLGADLHNNCINFIRLFS